MPPVYRLTLLPYLQAWNTDDASLTLHVMAFPTGDPRVSLTKGLGIASPAFAAANLVLEANLSRSVGKLPLLNAVDERIAIPLTMPDNRLAVFNALAGVYKPTGKEQPYTRGAEHTIRKYLPRSYRESFAFTTPKTPLALTDDTYQCMLRCPPDKPYVPLPPHETTWAEALGNAIRLPIVMRRAGILHTVTVPLPSAKFFDKGGWLFFTLAEESHYANAVAKPNFFRTFATRIPALSTSIARSVFTAVLFPVFADEAASDAAPGNYDEIFPEAIAYDDGFSKIVHARQPLAMDHLDEDGTGPAPVAERGIFLGWDDEDILIGQNRARGLNADGSEPAEAPRGVAGYRVDVREQGVEAWSTLSAVHTDHVRIGALDLGPFDGELRTEAHPRRIQERVWLPAWLATWTGGSMVVDTLADKMLRSIPNPKPALFTPVGEEETPLRYGKRYELRVRMADATGGGPALGDLPFRGAEAPVARLHFKRRLPPKKLSIVSHHTNPPQTTIVVERPRLLYPDAVFAGIENAVEKLLEIRAIAEATPEGDPIPDVALPDVDVEFAEIRVLVRPPGFDTANARLGWREMYKTWRAFDDADELQIQGEFVDAAQVSELDLSGQLGEPGSQNGPLILPTARDLRIELRALGRNDLTYFADERSRRSEATSVELHVPAFAETNLFRALDPTRELRSVFLRNDSDAATPAPATIAAQHNPSPNLVDRLANAMDAVVSEGTLIGNPGERIVFGCAGLKHRLSPDNASLTLTQRSELAGVWINSVRLELDRDWTWKGAECPTLTVKRTILRHPGNVTDGQETIGSLDLLHSVSHVAVDSKTPQRDRSVFLFLDAFPSPLWEQLPYEFTLRYDVEVRLEGGKTVKKMLETVLPVTTPPRQVPQVVSAGHALSPYGTDEDYASTAPRARRLWLEFAKAPEDKRDAFFVRVVAHAPDPMLLACAEPVADPTSEPKSPLDPEYARMIVPGQADDFAGLGTMQRLLPAEGSDRHWIVPLPPGTSSLSPELFGFYQYEIRVGHDRGTEESPFWSTAQGRFGPAVRIEGVQHPAPMLPCAVTRQHHNVIASAPFAQPFYRGANVLPDPPNTEIWIALYAQVHQADRTTMRNVQLEIRRGQLQQQTGVPREKNAEVTWTIPSLRLLLAPLGLDEHAALSVLAVELLPEPNGAFLEPLGGDLGDVRILRTSPLIQVQRECC